MLEGTSRGATAQIQKPCDRLTARNFPNGEYHPAVRRVRKSIPVSAYESLLGTDFTFADLGFVNLHDRKFSLLGDETFAGMPAYKVQEIVAGPVFYYSRRIVTWVAKDSLLPLRRDCYDAANQLWKTELYQDTAIIDGVPTVLRMRMEDKLIVSQVATGSV